MNPIPNPPLRVGDEIHICRNAPPGAPAADGLSLPWVVVAINMHGFPVVFGREVVNSWVRAKKDHP